MDEDYICNGCYEGSWEFLSDNQSLVLLLCSGNPGGRDEWSPALLHLPLLRPGPGCAGSGRTHGLRALEGKQAQTLLLITEQCFSGRVFVRVQHNNTTTVALLELSDGFEAQSQENRWINRRGDT